MFLVQLFLDILRTPWDTNRKRLDYFQESFLIHKVIKIVLNTEKHIIKQLALNDNLGVLASFCQFDMNLSYQGRGSFN